MTDLTEFHRRFDEQAHDIVEHAREALIDYGDQPTAEQIIAQIIMNTLDDGGVSEHGPDAAMQGRFSLEQKQRLMAIATHMGPDWCQALYKATVFMTKVA